MMRVLALALMILPLQCFAGGDFQLGSITKIDGDSSNLVFTFEHNGDEFVYLECKSLTVELKYERVPWFSWLPFMKTSHPSEEETAEAIAYMKKAFSEKSDVRFGYMGRGLTPTARECVVGSKGLSNYRDEGTRYVLFFSNPV